MDCQRCGGQVPRGLISCPVCGASITLKPSKKKPQWVSYKDSPILVKKLNDYQYSIAIRYQKSLQYIGEVHSVDLGRSWKFRASVESGYILEGICDDLDDGIKSIMRSLWGLYSRDIP